MGEQPLIMVVSYQAYVQGMKSSHENKTKN